MNSVNSNLAVVKQKIGKTTNNWDGPVHLYINCISFSYFMFK